VRYNTLPQLDNNSEAGKGNAYLDMRVTKDRSKNLSSLNKGGRLCSAKADERLTLQSSESHCGFEQTARYFGFAQAGPSAEPLAMTLREVPLRMTLREVPLRMTLTKDLNVDKLLIDQACHHVLAQVWTPHGKLGQLGRCLVAGRPLRVDQLRHWFCLEELAGLARDPPSRGLGFLSPSAVG